MNSYAWRLVPLFLLISFNIFGQRLKKADRTIVSNIGAHVAAIGNGQTKIMAADSLEEGKAAEYISKQFARSGLKPKGDSNTWFQRFEIYDGKTIQNATHLTINSQKLKLFEDYFPFPFSAQKSAESAVAIALSENGVPWFKDLQEIVESEDSAVIDTFQLIRKRAISASQKGATALIIYNSAGKTDLVFDKYDQSKEVAIPVLYIRNSAFKTYCSDESAILDIALNVAMHAKSRKGNNIIGYADNNADSTIVAGANMNSETDVAALIEVARLLKPANAKNKNYLFIAYCSEKNGKAGINYFTQHSPIDLRKVEYSLNLDTVSVPDENPKGLHLVKQSIELIKNN